MKNNNNNNNNNNKNIYNKKNGREEMGQPVSLQVGVWIENKNEKWGAPIVWE